MSDGGSRIVWGPKPEQEGLLSVFQSHGYKIPVVAACAEGGVGVRTYYDWHDIPEFSRWWEDQANRFFQLQIAQVHAAVFASATGDAPGNPQAQKLFYERHDKSYCPQSRQKQEISGSLDLSHATPEELERLAHAVNDDPPADTGLPDAANDTDPAAGEVGTGAP